MFRFLRVQILYPCNAHCSWCATHRKNPLFRELHETGAAKKVNEFYSQVIRQLEPEQVFVSGGEPLLYPDITRFLNQIEDSTKQINVFTSYQFSKKLRQNIPFSDMPLDKIVLNHTTISFEPDHWHRMTAGFPFDLYVENIRAIASQPVRKRFKFIVNHPYLSDEISRFQSLIRPDRTFEFGMKVINDQGGGLNLDLIRESKALTSERIMSLDRTLANEEWGSKSYKVGSIESMRPVLESGDVNQCRYRSEPIELRFAFFKRKKDTQVLKYRYCPYFPSHFGHRYHLGWDSPEKLEINYNKGTFRKHCSDCRFLNYAGV